MVGLCIARYACYAQHVQLCTEFDTSFCSSPMPHTDSQKYRDLLIFVMTSYNAFIVHSTERKCSVMARLESVVVAPSIDGRCTAGGESSGRRISAVCTVCSRSHCGRGSAPLPKNFRCLISKRRIFRIVRIVKR